MRTFIRNFYRKHLRRHRHDEVRPINRTCGSRHARSAPITTQSDSAPLNSNSASPVNAPVESAPANETLTDEATLYGYESLNDAASGNATLAHTAAVTSLPMHHPLEDHPKNRFDHVSITALYPGGHVNGLRVIHNPKDAMVDIIFIHGLNGHPFNAWKHQNGSFWPMHFLIKEEDMPSVRIMTFGYDANITQWTLGAVGQNNITDHAKSLNESIGRIRARSKTETRKIIIVAHSLGGLLAKKAILMSETSHDPNPSQLKSHISAIAFLGTPHEGAGLANAVTGLASIMRAGGVRANVKLVGLLKRESDVLQEIGEGFLKWLKHRTDVSVYCFYESKELPRPIGMIVKRQSAILGEYGNETIDANHMDMIRFSDPNDGGYQSVSGKIIEWLGKIVVEQELVHTKEQKEMLQSLRFARSGVEKKKVAADGTCSWLLETHEWKTWVRDGGLLWISGSPGSGKSTVMTHALQAFKESPHSMKPTQHASFFFFGQGSHLERNLIGFYRSILLQIATANRAIMERLTEIYHEGIEEQGGIQETWNWSEVDLKAVLFEFTNKATFINHLWIFVDALDEAGEDTAHRLSETFNELVSSSQGQIRICFSSRHYPVLKQHTELKVCVEENNKTDIIKFSKSRIGAYPHHLDEEELDKVVDAVALKSQGIFLWVELVIKFLSKHLSSQLQFILDRIGQFPPGLEDFYQERLNNILLDQSGTSTASEQSRELGIAQSRTLLQWLCFSMRPLTLQELKVALVLGFERPERSLQECLDAKDYIPKDEALQDAIVTRSRGLAHVYSESPQKVEFIHQSVKDFLRKELGQLGLSPGLAHHSICSSCLKFLSLDVYEDTITRENTFGHYARKYWHQHGYLAEIEDINQSRFLPLIMSHQVQQNLRFWWGTKQNIFFSRADHLLHYPITPPKVSHILSACGLLSMLKAGLNQSFFLGDERDDESGGTLLHWAIMGHQMEVVRFLLNRNDIDVNAKDHNGRTPLHLAASSSRPRYMSIYPPEPADMSQIISRNIDDKTVLYPWLDSSCETILSLILSSEKVDVHAQESCGKSPLMVAATQQSNSAFVRLLAHEKTKNDIYARDEFGSTALDIASWKGHTDKAELLLQKRYERISSKGSNDDLAASTARGRVALLDWMREERTPGSKGHRPMISLSFDDTDTDIEHPLLHFAVKEGHADAVACLLAHGCSPDALDSYGRGALHWAAKSGNKELVSLLMKWGPNLNLQDKQNHKPFHKAVLKGYLDIARDIMQQSQPHDDKQRPMGLEAAVMNDDVERALECLSTETRFGSLDQFDSPFEEAVMEGDLKVAQWAFRSTESKVIASQYFRERLLASCGSPEVRNWLENEIQAFYKRTSNGNPESTELMGLSRRERA